MMAGVSAAVPDDDLAVLAEVQGVLIEVLETRNAELAATVAELAERLARLERAVSRNSGNSGMPPSADDLPGKVPPAPKPKRGGGKRQGKQPGAPGAHLAWSDDPDDGKPLFPRGECGCGRDLAEAADLGVAASHQVMTPRWSRRSSRSTTGTRWRAAAGRCTSRRRRRGRRGGDGDLRAEPAGLVRVPAGRSSCPGRAVRGHHRGADGDPPVGRVRPLDDRPRGRPCAG